MPTSETSQMTRGRSRRSPGRSSIDDDFEPVELDVMTQEMVKTVWVCNLAIYLMNYQISRHQKNSIGGVLSICTTQGVSGFNKWAPANLLSGALAHTKTYNINKREKDGLYNLDSVSTHRPYVVEFGGHPTEKVEEHGDRVLTQMINLSRQFAYGSMGYSIMELFERTVRGCSMPPSIQESLQGLTYDKALATVPFESLLKQGSGIPPAEQGFKAILRNSYGLGCVRDRDVMAVTSTSLNTGIEGENPTELVMIATLDPLKDRSPGLKELIFSTCATYLICKKSFDETAAVAKEFPDHSSLLGEFLQAEAKIRTQLNILLECEDFEIECIYCVHTSDICPPECQAKTIQLYDPLDRYPKDRVRIFIHKANESDAVNEIKRTSEGTDESGLPDGDDEIVVKGFPFKSRGCLYNWGWNESQRREFLCSQTDAVLKYCGESNTFVLEPRIALWTDKTMLVLVPYAPNTTTALWMGSRQNLVCREEFPSLRVSCIFERTFKGDSFEPQREDINICRRLGLTLVWTKHGRIEEKVRCMTQKFIHSQSHTEIKIRVVITLDYFREIFLRAAQFATKINAANKPGSEPYLASNGLSKIGLHIKHVLLLDVQMYCENITTDPKMEGKTPEQMVAELWPDEPYDTWPQTLKEYFIFAAYDQPAFLTTENIDHPHIINNELKDVRALG